MKPSVHVLIAELVIVGIAAPAFAQEPLFLIEPRVAAKPVQSETIPSQPDLEELLPIGRNETIYERFPTGEVRIERQVTLDDDHNYVNHGPWKMFDRTGNLVAEGQFDMGRRTGVWTKMHAQGNTPSLANFPFNRFQAPFLSTARFTNDVLDGHWLIVDKQERKVMQVSIEDGERHGLVISWLPNGQIARQSNYERGVPVGDVLVLKPNAEEMQRTASFLEGRKIVSKSQNYRRGGQKQIEELFLAPKTVQKTPDSFWDMRFAEYEQVGEEMRHGPSKEWYANGQLKREGRYTYGKRTGRFTYWHANGQKLSEGEYRSDKQHGRWVWWHDNGLTSAIGEYAQGQQVGNWLWWESTGKLIKQGVAKAPTPGETRSAAKPSQIR